MYIKVYIPRWLNGKESAYQCRRCKRCGFDPWVGKIPWSRKWPPAPAFYYSEISQTEEPGRLQSTGLWRVRRGQTHTNINSAKLRSYLYTSNITHYQVHDLKIVSSNLWVAFHSDTVLLFAKAFYLNELQLTYLSVL